VAAQEIEALKLDMEHMNSRTEEIGVKLDGFEGKFSTLSDQMNRLELLLSESIGRNTVLEEERRHATEVAAAAVATEARAAELEKSAAAQGAGPSQPPPDEQRGQGHS
jgi:peptidoglycan hydrolase CwlO-like protein